MPLQIAVGAFALYGVADGFGVEFKACILGGLDNLQKRHTISTFIISCGACERVAAGKIAPRHTPWCHRTYYRAYGCVADLRNVVVATSVGHQVHKVESNEGDLGRETVLQLVLAAGWTFWVIKSL